jgi:hypothetical protein
MVAVIIIAVLFTGLAIAVAYGASKGSFSAVGDALQTTSRGGSRILNATVAIVIVGVGVAVPLVFIIGNRNTSNAQVGGIKLTPAMQAGRELFGEHCGMCHTLAADNSVGKTGPNLDVLRPSEATVAHTIANGCLQSATSGDQSCLGYGNMPANIVTGRDAADIAAFVGKIAGHA